MNRMKARFIRFILYILLKSAFLKYNPVSMPKKLPPQAVLLNMTIGHWVARLIHVAAKLRIADHLRKGPRTAADLATAARVQGAPLYRVLRALSSVGVFAETKDGRFKLTPLAALLRTDVPDSMNGWAMMINEPYNWKAWCEVLHSVQTGENAFQKAYGMNFFERLERHPEDLAVFGESMTSLSRAENPAVAAACKLKGKGTIVDVGGGHGSLLAAILRTNRKWQGVLYDQPSVIARAKQDDHVTAKDIAARCRLEGGSFFESAPKGGDVYIMKYILHDWDDVSSVAILKNCREAMHPKGRVLVVDNVIPPGNDPGWGKLLDIQMLVIGGRERTKKEFAALFAEAGLKLSRVIPTKAPVSIVEGIRA